MTPGATPLSRTATPTPWPFRFAAQAAVAPLVRGKSVTSAVYGSAPVALTGESTTTFVTPAARPRLPSLDALISPLTASISGRLVTTRARAAASADSAPVPWTITRTRAASPCFACSTCATWASVGSIVGTAAAGTSTTGSVGWSVGAGVCSGAAAGAGVGTEAGGEAGAGAGAVCRVAVAGWADFVGRFAVRCASGWTVTRCGVGRFFARLVFEWAGAGADPRAGVSIPRASAAGGSARRIAATRQSRSRTVWECRAEIRMGSLWTGSGPPASPNRVISRSAASFPRQTAAGRGSGRRYTRPVPGPFLRVIPLGGLGEVGKNMTVFEHEHGSLVVDAGLAFPRDEHLGVDLVLPDLTYLRERPGQVRAVVLTHAHEDHVGGLPYLLREVQVPEVWATRLTLGLVKSKLDEHGLLRAAELREIEPERGPIELGPFRVDFVRMAHSVPDNVAVVLETEAGRVLHTSDWKLDHTPVDGYRTDVGKLTELGNRGVDLLLCDSTN